MLPAVAKAETFSDSPVIVEPAIPEVYKSLDAKWQSFVKACVDLRPCVDTALEHARKAGPGSAKKIDPTGNLKEHLMMMPTTLLKGRQVFFIAI